MLNQDAAFGIEHEQVLASLHIQLAAQKLQRERSERSLLADPDVGVEAPLFDGGTGFVSMHHSVTAEGAVPGASEGRAIA